MCHNYISCYVGDSTFCAIQKNKQGNQYSFQSLKRNDVLSIVVVVVVVGGPVVVISILYVNYGHLELQL
jgi:hypothetical protein